MREPEKVKDFIILSALWTIFFGGWILLCWFLFHFGSLYEGSIHVEESFKLVVKQEQLSKEQACLLYAIRLIENGGPGKEFGVIRKNANTYKDGFLSYIIQCDEAARLIKKHFKGDYREFAEKYAHPKDVNEWSRNIKFAMLIAYLRYPEIGYEKGRVQKETSPTAKH